MRTLAAAAFAFVLPALASPSAAEPPGDAGRWVPLPALTDEFDGPTLDANKWHDHNPGWKGRRPGFFARHNVRVGDGQLQLTMRAETLEGVPKGYHTFTAAAVQSKALARYGYYEVRARPMDSRGSSSFWFYDNTPEEWTEIDVFEMGARHPEHERLMHTNVHVFHTPAYPDRHWSRSKAIATPYRLADEWHVYALRWDVDEIAFYIDGNCVRTIANTHWHQPLTLNFDSETMPRWFGLPDPNRLPATYRIDYVRAWRRAGGYDPPRWRSCRFRFPAAEGRRHRGKTKAYAIGSDGGVEVRVVARHVGGERPGRAHVEPAGLDAWLKRQTGEEPSRAVRLRDADGKGVAVRFTWRKATRKEKAGDRRYVIDRVAIDPSDGRREGERTFRFRSGEALEVRMTLTY